MVDFSTNFDANKIAPSAPRELLPPGKYLMQIIKSEKQDTRTGGEMLVLEMEILEGPAQGRRVWDRLNLKNANTQAVEIAHRTLSAICHATNKLDARRSDQLHFVPMLVTVAVAPPRRGSDGKEYGPSNVVRGYEASDRSRASTPVEATGKRKLPWAVDA